MTKVVVGIIPRPRGSEIEYLLVSSNKDFGQYTGYFYPPGGHVESGESIQGALVREIFEEVGLEVDPIHQIAETPGDVPDQTTYWWECAYIKGNLTIDSTELAEAKFVTISEMNQLPLWPATEVFFKKYF